MLVHLMYIISGLFDAIRDSSLCFPCHSHAFLLSKKKIEMNEKGGSKGKERKMEKERKERNRKVVNKVFRMGV